ncbi:hypothetical protein [Xanthobacter agilis]|uniref:hypothetical protein n=1 Tax=Xanthobacter agilis TaxID=47492 RepID=UPI003728F5D1
MSTAGSSVSSTNSKNFDASQHNTIRFVSTSGASSNAPQSLSTSNSEIVAATQGLSDEPRSAENALAICFGANAPHTFAENALASYKYTHMEGPR